MSNHFSYQEHKQKETNMLINKSELYSIKALLFMILAHLSTGWFNIVCSLGSIAYFVYAFLEWKKEENTNA